MQASNQGAVRAADTFDSERTLAIIGAGFSGTAVAI
jgi:cation diffusion facilitator CzcD-associated flavoprotein CzcO